MRAMILPAALTVLLAGCGFDPAPTAPDDAKLPPPEPALDFAPPQLAAAVTNAWATKAPLPVARAYSAAAVLNGLLYVVGGATDDDPATRTVHAYNPGGNSWTTKASLPAGRWAPSAGVINGVLYVAGGLDPDFKPTRTLFAYTPATNTWATKAPMLVAGACGAGGVIGGKLYVFTQCWSHRRRIPALRSGDQHLGAAADPGLPPPVSRRRRDRRRSSTWRAGWTWTAIPGRSWRSTTPSPTAGRWEPRCRRGAVGPRAP